MRYSLVLIYILFFNHMFSQDVQQVEVLKNDKQVTVWIKSIGLDKFHQALSLKIHPLQLQPAFEKLVENKL